ncbi:C-type lectin domain family 4 member E-like isoform X1 [Paramisgurnus dabryanus]|uniref:C-type lectin domain family 4 member E-like isoform X1 n=1 Tax=Paramisgurnus dabryanus TaxID=90735 RepID=UPI0031F35F9E
MDSIYQNSTYIKTITTSSSKCSQPKGQVKGTQSRWSKVLLLVLCVSVVLAVGGLCVLGILYNNNLADFESLNEQHDTVLMQLSAQEINSTNYKKQSEELSIQHEETLRKLNRLNESTGCALCAVDWIHSGGKCYYFSRVMMNWTQSRDHCVTLGGHLVIINSEAEQDFLTSKVKETHWIGLNDMETEGRWVWVNNQPLNDSMEFWIKRSNGDREPDNWTRGHPGGEDCAGLGHIAGDTDFWSDGYCFDKKRFVCEAPASV